MGKSSLTFFWTSKSPNISVKSYSKCFLSKHTAIKEKGGFLLDFDKDNYRQRNNGTLVKYGKSELVIYHDHSYQFNTTIHKYKDNIGTLRALYGWGFMETVNHLRRDRDKENYKPMIPNYNKFD